MSRSLGRSLRPLTLPTPTLPRRHRGYARRRRPAVGNIGSGGKQQQDSGGVVGTTRSMFALFRHIQLMRAVRRIPALLRSHQQLGLRRVSGRPRHPAPGTVRRVPRRGRHRVRVRRPTRRRRPLTYTSAPAATPCCRCRGRRIAAGMAELVDALDSKSSTGDSVRVRVSLPAPNSRPVRFRYVRIDPRGRDRIRSPESRDFGPVSGSLRCIISVASSLRRDREFLMESVQVWSGFDVESATGFDDPPAALSMRGE